MGNFLKTAAKQRGDVRDFLRDAAGSNSIKYAPEKGARHIVYIPYQTQVVIDEETGTESTLKSIYSISADIHEWKSADGKYNAVICTKGAIVSDDNGNLLTDGSCPFCDRISDSWDIYNYRKELEAASCQLTGEQRDKHLEKANSQFADERKTKDARAYLYVLVVKFRINDQNQPILGADGLPEYDIKVMKLSSSRVEKIQQQVVNSGAELADAELIFEYPSVDDRRLLVSQSTTTPVFPNNKITVKYNDVINKINNDVAKFNWDGLDKSFPELGGMSTAEAKAVTTSMFEQWDAYKKELVSNPNAKYLEYVIETPSAKPSLGVGAEGTPVIPAVPNMPVIPTVPTAATAPAPAKDAVTLPNIPVAGDAGAAVQPATPVAPVAPVAPAVDPNAVFANPGPVPVAPTINM